MGQKYCRMEDRKLGLGRQATKHWASKSDGVAFTTTLIAWPEFNSNPDHVVASLEKMLYDDYLCLVASNKQQIQWTRI